MTQKVKAADIFGCSDNVLCLAVDCKIINSVSHLSATEILILLPVSFVYLSKNMKST
jgi:hypothetical protein